jgi:pentatricopeptide repeat protein
MMEVYSKMNRIEDASALLKLMIRHKIPLTNQYFNLLIVACGRRKNYSLATTKFKEMANFGLKPDVSTWNALIECCCLCGKLTEARELLVKLQSEGLPNTESYAPLIRAYAKQKNITEAYNLFEEMTKVVSVLQLTSLCFLQYASYILIKICPNDSLVYLCLCLCLCLCVCVCVCV